MTNGQHTAKKRRNTPHINYGWSGPTWRVLINCGTDLEHDEKAGNFVARLNAKKWFDHVQRTTALMPQGAA